MRAGHHYQPLSYDIRLPDEVQADALRLLDASRAVVNAALVQLWPSLDAFMEDSAGPAWKQVGRLMRSPDPHGDRQWRCESETAGRIMRAQAERKQVFLQVQPVLTEGFIRPEREKRPDSYEALQPAPLLSVGLLSYAGDDGGAKGQSYRLSFDEDAGTATLRFRFSDAQGHWQWCGDSVTLTLPEVLVERLKAGGPLAPTLRERILPDGSRVAVLDVSVQVKKAELTDWTQVERVLGFDWGVNTLITAAVLEHTPSDPEHPLQVSRPLFINTGGLDGHQARTRRQIDELKAARDKLAEEDPKRALYEKEIRRGWRLYEARNRELAHLAANLLLLFAQVWGCALICGESLKTLKFTGRGRGRWRNYRNNTTIRSDIGRILRYKCHLVGIRYHSEHPRGTSHTCPHCGKPAHTYRSPRPEHRAEPVKWGRWLWCAHCGYNADRDYCAALNIARLGIAFLTFIQTTGQGKAFSVTEIDSVKPCPYMAHGAVLLFPPHTDLHRLLEGGKLYINCWRIKKRLRICR